ncbi:hypothetical protein [Yinghuangia soli]|uniref:Uncharacterized protein n=1 Tax=Yinghuangia soli TaxID=2908204 RepID=A0AA41QAN2_9ACTN|nr:hypothetical protein [Yinghuangia soli]MCF2533292.1 hypothetical protein [Yinghuangia soli]
MVAEGAGIAVHGVGLVERVIAEVRRDPGASALSYRDVPWVDGGVARPMDAEVLAAAVFPSGRPLPPSVRTWLAYDASLFERHEWFDDDGDFAPRALDELVADELGDMWGELFEPVAARLGECFLLPGGSDSRRILAVTEPDQEGEYPVLAVDVDDLPFVGLMYPGFDVYLGNTAGLVAHEFETYTGMMDDPVYARRMHRHAARTFGGESCFEYPF